VTSRYRNLIGVPSYHFDPLYAQAVRLAFRDLRPAVVALELPVDVRGELSWSLSRWPEPVVALSDHTLFPFVPGDSILEGFRLAVAAEVPVELVDIDCEPETTPEHARPSGLALGPELADRPLMAEVVDALTPPSAKDIVREAHMAKRLAELMVRYELVLWVGGAAHWVRIVERLRAAAFNPSAVHLRTYSSFRRMPLGSTGLYAISSQLPRLVQAYVADPDRFRHDDAIGDLFGSALHSDTTTMLAGTPEASPEDEPAATTGDATRALLYARNLALARGLRTRATFEELLTAALAVGGGRYAGQVYDLAMAQAASAAPRLEWSRDNGVEGWRYGEEWIDARPWSSRPSDGLPGLTLRRFEQRRPEPYVGLPASDNNTEKKYWQGYPPDMRDYRAFVHYTLRLASTSAPSLERSAPFVSGLGDGLDARATIRSRAQGDRQIFVKEQSRGRLRFTNAIVDWTSASERSDILQGRTRGGWIDPSPPDFGCASWEVREREMLQSDPYHVQRDTREYSFITVDLPNVLPDRPSFYDKVILPLVQLRDGAKPNDVYAWLDVFCAFCAGKRVAYFSQYVPGPLIDRVAKKHHVELTHFPLRAIPEPILQRNRSFRFMWLTRDQWETLHERLAGADEAWSN
jgi:hypothetical protein